MTVTKNGSVIELDIHGMYESEAEHAIRQFLSSADQGVREVIIIHGYRSGQVLKEMVRTRLRHPRIQSKLLSLNEGQTRLILK